MVAFQSGAECSSLAPSGAQRGMGGPYGVGSSGGTCCMVGARDSKALARTVERLCIASTKPLWLFEISLSHTLK
jgi:hypothetical protein